MKKTLVTLLQLAIGIGLLVFIFSRMPDRDALWTAFRSAWQRWPIMAAGVASFFVCLFFCAIRWSLLLEARGLAMPFPRVLALYLSGHFFNAFLFGATGGDVVKAWLVTREAPRARTEAITTIALDRIIGLLALVGLTFAIMLVRLRFYLADPAMRGALVFILLVLAGAVLFLVLAFGKDRLEHWAWFQRLEARTVLGKIVSRAYETFRGCLRHPTLLGKALALSLLNHVALVVSSYLLAFSLGVDLGFWDAITVLPVINMVAALPITPGGLGTRETAATFLLGAVGIGPAQAVAVSLTTYGAMLAWSVISGLVYIAYVGRRGLAGRKPADPNVTDSAST